MHRASPLRCLILAGCLYGSAAAANTPKFFLSNVVHIETNTVKLTVHVSADLLVRMVDVPREEEEFLLPAEEQALRDGLVALIARECSLRINLTQAAPKLAGFALATADDIGKPEMKYWPGGRARLDLAFGTPAPKLLNMNWSWNLFPRQYAEPDEDPGSPPRNLDEVVAEIYAPRHPPALQVFSKYNAEYMLHAQDQDRHSLYAGNASFRFSKLLLLPLGALLAVLWGLRKRSAWLMLFVAGLGMLALGWFGHLLFEKRKPLFELEQHAMYNGQYNEGGRRAEIAGTMLSEVYRCFNYEEDEARYDGLAGLVDATLLPTLYRELQRGGGGGSRSRVFQVETVGLEAGHQGLRPIPWFDATVTWRAHGFVGHAGHQHKRILESTALLTFQIPPGEQHWYLGAVDVHEQQRILDETQWQANP